MCMYIHVVSGAVMWHMIPDWSRPEMALASEKLVSNGTGPYILYTEYIHTQRGLLCCVVDTEAG